MYTTRLCDRTVLSEDCGEGNGQGDFRLRREAASMLKLFHPQQLLISGLRIAP